MPWSWAALALVAGSLGAGELSAQPEPRWTVVPLAGFGFVFVDDSRNSGGLEAALELEYGGPKWRVGGLGSLRGIGVGCSEACFDGGPALAAGVSWALGPLWIGGGFGTMKQRGSWSALPFGRASIQAGPARIELRAERPQADGSGLYLPLLVGFPMPLRSR